MLPLAATDQLGGTVFAAVPEVIGPAVEVQVEFELAPSPGADELALPIEELGSRSP
jgi:hypothetical protein